MIRETFFARQSQAEGQPYVLLPGLGLTGHYLHRLAKTLARTADVWIAEFRGPPTRPGFPGLLVADVADAVGDWMEQRNVRSAVVIGHSFGGQVAAELAMQRPDLVDRLVLVAPSLDRTAPTIWRQMGRICRDAFHEPLSLIVIATLCYLRNGIRALRMLNAALRSPLECSLPGLRQPTLIIRGEKDAVVTGPWIAEVAQLIPRASLVTIPRSAHGVVFSNAAAVSDAIGKWVGKTAKEAASPVMLTAC